MLEATRLKFHRILNAFLIVVLLGMSGVVYVSAHGGDVTLIHACVNNRNGAVRIISASGSCDATRETALDWNIQGPKGDTGPQGAQGPAGPMGPQGPAGTGTNFYTRYAWFTVQHGQDGTRDGSGSAFCDPGDQVISGGGGGGGYGGGTTVLEITTSGYDSATQSQFWSVAVYNNGSIDQTLVVFAVCADTAP